MLINTYNFSVNVKVEDIWLFIGELNDYIMLDSASLAAHEIQQNFFNIVHNLHSLKHYLGVDVKWSKTYPAYAYPPEIDEIKTNLIRNVKLKLQQILITSVLQATDINVIFEFHRFNPFIIKSQQIYEWLINSLLDIDAKLDINISIILSLYLMHAAIYNNTSAIKILLEEYKVSPIAVWLDLPQKYAYSDLTIMPILLATTIPVKYKNQLRFFDISEEQQQANFILMIQSINFSKEDMISLQIEQIFRCAFEHNFLLAIDCLLDKINNRTNAKILNIAYQELNNYKTENAQLLVRNIALQADINHLQQKITTLQVDFQATEEQNWPSRLFNYSYGHSAVSRSLSSPPASPIVISERLHKYLKF